MVDGARLIVNSSYFHVAKPGEKAGKHCLIKNAVSDLVKYVATRESVSFNMKPEFAGMYATENQKKTINELSEYLPQLKDTVEFKAYQDNENMLTASAVITRASYLHEKTGNNNPATDKQKQLIENIVKQYPETKETFEYQEYINNPTISSASELIMSTSENQAANGTLQSDDALNLVSYVANRPGVVKVGNHGLFGAEDDVDLVKAQKEISEHKGNVWTHVISLRRSDADALGYDTQQTWKTVVETQLDNIAKQHNISIKNLRWYAGMHNTGNHPHIHLFVYSVNPSEGYIDTKGIENMKSGFATYIFQDELKQVYINKANYQKEIEENVQKILSDIQKNPSVQYTENQINTICNNMQKLAQYTTVHKGRLQYRFIKPEMKQLVKSIYSDVSKGTEIQKLYSLWSDERYKQLKLYSSKGVVPELENNDDFFKLIRQKILNQAKEIAFENTTFHFKQSEDISYERTYVPSEDYPEPPEDISGARTYVPSEDYPEPPEDIGVRTYVPSEDYPEPPEDIGERTYVPSEDYPEPPEEYVSNNITDINVNTLNLPNKAITANMDIDDVLDAVLSCNVGKENITNISEKAYNNLLLKNDDKSKNILANLFVNEVKVNNDTLNAAVYVANKEILENLIKEDKNKPDAKTETEIAKMYAHGLGTNADNNMSLQYLMKAANNGDKDSLIFLADGGMPKYQYKLAKSYIKENPETNAERIYNLLYTAAAKGHLTAKYELIKTANKYNMELPVTLEELCQSFANDVENEIGYVDEHTELNSYHTYLTSTCGDMYNYILHNPKEAARFYTLSAENGNNVKLYPKLAKLYENNIGKIDEELNCVGKALNYYGKTSEQEKYLYIYRMGKLYQYGSDNIEKNIEMSDYLYKQAYAGFEKIAKGEVIIEDKKAFYSKDYFSYMCGKMCLDGQGLEQDYEKAFEWFKKSAEEKNPYAVYDVGKMLYNGDGVQQDKAEAYKWYLKSAEFGNVYAMYNVANMLNNGDGVQENKAQAQEWYSRALKGFIDIYNQNPDGNISYKIANMYCKGLEVQQDKAKAYKWYLKSAELGNVYAIYNVANMLNNGDGVQENKAQAQEWYSRALKGFIDIYNQNPDGDISYKIAGFYRYGLGTERDIDKAVEWYNKSAESGNEKATEKINEIHTDHKSSDTEHKAANAGVMQGVFSIVNSLAKFIGNDINDKSAHMTMTDKKLRQQIKRQKVSLGQSVNDNDMEYY